jgi:hypothetical protein
MIRSVTINLIIPTCAICQQWAPLDGIYNEPSAYYNVTPKGWVNVMSNIICERCMDELRSTFMEEQKPKVKPITCAICKKDGPVIPEVYNSMGYRGEWVHFNCLHKPKEEKKEEHWLTRNGTRVVVKMPLPAVGHFASEPKSISDERHLIRWDANFNCMELSWLQTLSREMLALYDLAERLEDSVKKEQG